jgi:hypothetical protein
MSYKHTYTIHDKKITKELSPVKAIREHCRDCSENDSDRKDCKIKTCALWPFRMGKDPGRAVRKMTDEQKAAAIERLRKATERKNP